ncbi:Arc family DNA-binding protein [Variovorax sp. ZT4R33]|uniref:Arc family DNA-binding protein n=1 Tax=Variovorax sp. ZT4R33 TaxID=3443743 RepID=UPI003F483788
MKESTRIFEKGSKRVDDSGMEPKQQPPYPLRIAPELRERLEREAASAKRSLNAEISARLERSFESKDRDAVAVAVSLASAERQAAMNELLLSGAVFSHASSAASLLQLLLDAPEACARVFGEEELRDVREEAEAAIAAAEAQDKQVSIDDLSRRFLAAGDRLAEARRSLRQSAAYESESGGSPIPNRGLKPPVRKILVGNIGADQGSIYDKGVAQADPMLAKKPANRGPTRSANARKPKP